jgi:hypothetical protein
MPATQWDQTVGDTRTMRLRDTATVTELVIVLSEEVVSAVLRIYDVTGPLGPDGADMTNLVLRETRPANPLLLAWYKAGQVDAVLWKALQDAADSSATRRQAADQAAQVAADAVVAIVPTVDVAEVRDAVRRLALAALGAGG